MEVNVIIAIQDNLKYSSTFIIVPTLEKQPISDVHLTEKLAPVGIMGHNKGPPEARVISEHYRTKGFKGVLNWSTIMPKDASLSSSWYNFSSPTLYRLDSLTRKNKSSIEKNKI